MATLSVKVRSDQGDLGTHPKYGALIPGATISIDETDFSAQLFEPLKKTKEVKDHV